MSDFSQGIFRVVGRLFEEYLSVQYDYVKSCEPFPPTPLGGKILIIRDDLQIDRVPIEMVLPEDRMPNTLLKITVRDRTVVVKVERANIK